MLTRACVEDWVFCVMFCLYHVPHPFRIYFFLASGPCIFFTLGEFNKAYYVF
jgi:hypothetical protein